MGIILPHRSQAFKGVGVTFLDTLLSNMELELDATESTSYSGSGQTWANVITSPDSGAAKTDNDFFLGLTSGSESTDPTFNVDRFDFDGGDLFACTTAGGTTFMNEMHFSTNPFTMIMVFDIGSTLADADRFFANGFLSTGGILLSTEADGDLSILQRSGTGAADGDTSVAISMATTTTDNVMVVSVDYADDSVSVWYNSKTPVKNSTVGWDTRDDNPSSDTPSIAANINNQFLPSGDAMSFFAIRNKITTDAEAESIIDYLSDKGLIAAI